MKSFFTRLIKLLPLLFMPGFLFAQNVKDYSLLLNSGKFVPEQNTGSLSKDAAVFQKSLFNDKYYVTIQFNSLPTEATKAQLKLAGIELLDYIPNNAYTAAVRQTIDLTTFRNFSIRSVMYLTAAQKTVPDILINKTPAHAIKTAGFADVDILLYEKLTADKIIGALTELGASIIADVPVFRMYTIRIPQNNLSRLAALPFVQWTEFIAPPNVPENLPGRSLHRTSVLNDGVRNLRGDGMNIGVWDEIASQHLDFSPAGRLINVETGTAGSHGTHVSGTIGGKGIINPSARGMAPNATIYSYNGFNNDVQVEMATAIPANMLISSNHSYHDGLGVQCGVTGASVSYSLRARNTDINLNNNLYHLHCHSSGNNQTSCSGGWGTITGTGKAAKNNVVVGSVTTSEVLSTFSSCGPVHDGRVKPEIVAMGENVFSTYTPLNTYNTISGTSMSTPGITGTLALLAQRYKQLNGNVLPPSALIKNIACNTAADLGNAGPDYRFGFGRVNALAAVRILEENRYVLNNVATGATNDITVTVPAGAARLRVMLTWNDPAATTNSSFALVNNLDLTVINGVTTSLPWILDPNNPATAATKAVDNISNIEQVTVDNPSAGTYTLRVNGTAVPVGANQEYALTWIVEQPYIEVIYPNGNESLSSGGSQVITWDNAGITGTQTVEYSLNNGGSWTTVNTVPAATTRLTWSIPSNANTSTALVRVTSGAITDVSDATFKILGTPSLSIAGAGCSSGEINYTWTAVANATEYDIYRLDAATGNFVLLAANLTGTSFTATGLTPGATVWAALVAKNNTTGAVSERSLAVSATVSNGGGLSTIGSISGQTTVCGATNSVQYTVPLVSGASSYTWTSPPNTTISSGQGTNTVIVNYFASSTNGNVTVFASAGVCQTATASLAVAIGPVVAAPTAGGDQTVTVCPPNPVPTLTATATVPAGHMVIWYDAATNGSAVGSPTLSSTGTVTYYAASRNTTTSCESAVRSAVKLTINAALPATITAGGPITFCAGNNVMLTASSGTSYLWSNGATTQAITVAATGSYSVVVTTGGCNLTSAATDVTVNTLPAATIAAGGPTTFCDGNNVVLTASAGSSWLWSNGATTQSITATTSGTNTVRVTNASGCFANSAATTITVNTKPTVTVSAAPYTKLFPGLSTTLTAAVSPAGTYTYTWSKNGTPVNVSGNNSTLNVSLAQLGSYTMTVTNNSVPPCTNTSAAVVIADSATSKLFVYPNPTDGDFQVRYYTTATGAHTVSVYDAKGAMVFRKAYTVNNPYQQLDVDVKKHGSGVYQVVLHDRNGKKLAAKQVVVQ